MAKKKTSKYIIEIELVVDDELKNVVPTLNDVALGLDCSIKSLMEDEGLQDEVRSGKIRVGKIRLKL